ncbi:MAG: C39 family peptidase [Spirochaetales bacterium]|nr:C39 family peptidase [Spirochaetales bacterium]
MESKEDRKGSNESKKIPSFVWISLLALSLVFLLSFSFFHFQKPIWGSNDKSEHQAEDSIPVSPEYVPYIPPYHIFSPGETIYDIASLYGVSWSEIVRFNKISDIRKLRPGERILIPSGIKLLKNISLPQDIYPGSSNLPSIISIQSSVVKDKVPLSAELLTLFDFHQSLSPVWDFGTGQFSFAKKANFTYLKPGEFQVRFSLADDRGREVFSNTLYISADPVNLSSDEEIFLTLDAVGAGLDLSGRFYDESGEVVVFDSRFKLMQDPALIEKTYDNHFRAVAPGYTKVSLVHGPVSYQFFLFVSPFPSQHSVEPEFNWYKTQFNTGMYGNCGPACVAMAVHWATGERITVKENREEIGLPIKNGAVSFAHMERNFRYHRIKTFLPVVNDFSDMKAIIDKGNIAIILFNTTYIQPVEGDESLVFVDRYYPDTTGHYVVIKGYSLDEKYFIIYDPIPGEWKHNLIRYTDGVSMIGRNRYFLADQIFESIKGKKVLEIERKKSRAKR